MAIIFLAAHDAFATVTGEFRTRTNLRSLRTASQRIRSAVQSLDDDEVEKEAVFAMQAAALTAAKLLYPSRRRTIDPVLDAVTEGARSEFVEFGETFGEELFESRLNDGSQRPQLDDEFEIGELLRHQPDPNFPIVENDPNAVQRNFGRFWGEVTPFAIRDVERDAFLGPFPELPSREYRENLEEVTIMGECNEFTNDDGILLQDIGIFWGYDGAPRLGTPPRLFLQTVLAIDEVQELSLPHSVRAITAVGVSMADAGIAAWYWKFFYDLWRPTSGVRNDTITPDPDWDPRGLPLSNLDRTPRPPECVGLNPDFPAYPSGHATFGAAAFFTIAKVLGKETKDLVATITSDEFNGRTTEGTTGEVRRVLTQTIDLQEAIDQNNAGRVYLGVHWRFDSDGGELVGKQISEFAARQFSI
ncbi:Vanadium chloroperoxidase [Gracilariopsis chorda]|nr:Vanadium chloroperoxidase [Gracilariopsis chorda]|eukprot:PXF44372.1 Vanadium chloroperoxidase [Gracilariopsis chorda]